MLDSSLSPSGSWRDGPSKWGERKGLDLAGMFCERPWQLCPSPSTSLLHQARDNLGCKCMDSMKVLFIGHLFSFICIYIFMHDQLLSHVWLFVTSWTVVHQAPLSMEFSRQEYWSGLPFPPPGHPPDAGIKSASPALAGGFFTTETPWFKNK